MRRFWLVLTVLSAGALYFFIAGCGAEKEKPETEEVKWREVPGELPGPEEETAVVSAGPLNLRSRPSLGGSVIRQLDVGDTLVILDRSDAPETIDGRSDYWYEVRTEGGAEGWVFGAYITIGAAPEPARAPGPAKEVTVNVEAAEERGWGARDYYEEGKSLHDRGDHSAALPYLKKATELEPENGDYHFYFALSLQELGRAGEAASEYEKAVKYKSDDFWAHNNLGLACIRSGQPARAVEVLERAVMLDPKGTADKEAALNVARRNLAVAYEMNGQPGKAEELRAKYNL